MNSKVAIEIAKAVTAIVVAGIEGYIAIRSLDKQRKTE